jgi:hypothetical protein
MTNTSNFRYFIIQLDYGQTDKVKVLVFADSKEQALAYADARWPETYYRSYAGEVDSQSVYDGRKR